MAPRSVTFGSVLAAHERARASDQPLAEHPPPQRQKPLQQQHFERGPIIPCYGVYEVNRNYDHYDHRYDYDYDLDYDHRRSQQPSLRTKAATTVAAMQGSSPERSRWPENGSGTRSRSRSNPILNVVPEERVMLDFPTSSSLSRGGSELEGQEEEEELEEWELDEALSERGLYRGSYRRLLLLYTLTPLTSILAFNLLAILPYIAYPLSNESQQPWWPYTSLSYFPHPLPDLLISAALFSLSYTLRGPISLIFEKLSPDPKHTTNTTYKSKTKPKPKPKSKLSIPLPLLFSTTTHTLVALLFLVFPLIAQPPPSPSPSPSPGQDQDGQMAITTRDGIFRRVWWMALGWAAAEAMAAVWSGYEARGWYKDVIVGVRKEITDVEESEMMMPERQPLLPHSFDQDEQHSHKIMEEQIEEELEELVAIRAREELEAAFGVPVIKIPVFLSCLQRINGFLLTQGLALLLAQAYLQSTLSIPVPLPHPPPFSYRQTRSNRPLALVVPVCVVVHLYLSILYTPFVLPKMGVPAVVYHASLVSLGVFFAGLAVWEGLV